MKKEKKYPEADVVIIVPAGSDIATNIYEKFEPLMDSIKKKLGLERELIVIKYNGIDSKNPDGISAIEWARGKDENHNILKATPPKVWVITDGIRENLKKFVFAVRSSKQGSETPIIVLTADQKIKSFINQEDVRSRDTNKLFVFDPTHSELCAAAIEQAILNPPKSNPKGSSRGG